jgi:hypothetical protein
MLRGLKRWRFIAITVLENDAADIIALVDYYINKYITVYAVSNSDTAFI